MIVASSLERSFGRTRAVSGVSFRVKRGEAVGFLGPNGAGKTTTFRMLAGVLAPTKGSIRIGEHDLEQAPLKAKALLGYMPENPPLYPEMTVHEYLLFRAELKGVKRRKQRAVIDDALTQAGAADMYGVRIAHLSKGYRQRVALADALLNDPPALLLDEPTAGLDPNQIADMRKLIRRLAKERAILLSTHVLSEVEATCSRAIVIHQGTLVAEADMEDLTSRSGKRAFVAVQTGSETAASEAAISAFEAAISAAPRKWSLRREPQEGAHFFSSSVSFANGPHLTAEVVAFFVEKGLSVTSAGPVKAKLDEVFSQLTTEAGGSEE